MLTIFKEILSVDGSIIIYNFILEQITKVTNLKVCIYYFPFIFFSL